MLRTLNMFKLPNPYLLAAGGVALLTVGGSMYIQSTLIHKYHVLYNCAEFGLTCEKGAETIPDLKAKIKSMTETQNAQTGKSEQNVIRVIQGPKEIQSIIREIQAAPAKPCTAPTYSDEVKNAF
jgi:hypothetical protein